MKKGVRYAGRQEDGKIWVLNKSLHINDNGEEINLAESPLTWPPIGGPSIQIGIGKCVSTMNIGSSIVTPLESSIVLEDLLKAMRSILKHNFIAGNYDIVNVKIV